MNIFQFFHLLLSQRDLCSMWQGSWIRLWTVRSLFCSMSRVVDWCLLRKITKHASLILCHASARLCSAYAYLEKFLIELEKHLWQDLLFKSCGVTDQSLLKWNSTQTLCQKSGKGVDRSIKRSKKFPRWCHDEGKPLFKTITIELKKQPKTKIITN